MKRVGLIASALLIMILSTFVLNPKTEIAFTSIEEAKNRIGASGFHCIADRADGEFANGVLVGRTPGQWEEANSMCKSRQFGPEWKGKVWISLNSDLCRSEVIGENVAWRTWGRVTAMGDANLLEELETALQSSQ